MAIGKFQGVMSPTTPIGSRVTSTSTPGRTDAIFSPAMRRHSPEKNRKIWPARAASPIPSGSVLPSSRERMRPSSSLRARISSPIFFRASCRSWGVVRDQAGNAAFAAATARSAPARSERGKRPTMSLVLDGLTSGLESLARTHSPATKLRPSISAMAFLLSSNRLLAGLSGTLGRPPAPESNP